MTHYIGVDVGGTKIAGIAYNAESQTVIHRQVIATDGKQGAEGVIQQVIDLVRTITTTLDWSLESVSGIGVGVPAVIDYDKGHTLVLPNIPGNWVDQPVTAPIQSALNRPVHLINDARAFTLAEASIGAGRGYGVVAGITLGTGIGGGVAVDGKLLLGLDGSAGEFGHIMIDHNGLPDGSGTPGGLESYGSGPAIAAAAVKAVMQGINTNIGALVDYDLNAITPAIVAQAADAGDPVAQAILHSAGQSIGAGIANVLTILNPHALVIGGGVAALGERILVPMREALAHYNRTTSIDKLAILPAEVADAGAVGAALWAKQRGM